MRDDELMDRLLRTAMTADVPELSPGFDARVMRGVRVRRLTPRGRVALAIYAVLAAATTVWLMQDVRADQVVAAVAIGLPVVGGATAYARRIALTR